MAAISSSQLRPGVATDVPKAVSSIMGSHERGMKHNDTNGKTWLASRKQLATKVAGAIFKGREGATWRVRDNLRDFQSYKRLVRTLAIPEVMLKSMPIEASGEETTAGPPVGGR
jgi:hypothetical protein